MNAPTTASKLPAAFSQFLAQTATLIRSSGPQRASASLKAVITKMRPRKPYPENRKITGQ